MKLPETKTTGSPQREAPAAIHPSEFRRMRWTRNGCHCLGLLERQRCRIIIDHESRILKKKAKKRNVMFRNWVKTSKHCNLCEEKGEYKGRVLIVWCLFSRCYSVWVAPSWKNHTKRCNHSQKTFFDHASWSRLLLGFKEVCGTFIYTNHAPNVLTRIIHQNGTRKSGVMMMFHQPGRPFFQE